MPGVFKVVTYKDVKGTNRIRGQVGCDSALTDGWERRIMVEEGDKIRQWGDVVAIVCADTETNARARGAEKSRSITSRCPELIDIYQAKAPDAIKVYDDIDGYDGMPNAWNKRMFQKGRRPEGSARQRRLRRRRRVPQLAPAAHGSRDGLRLRLLRRERPSHDSLEVDMRLPPPDDDCARRRRPSPSRIRVIQNNLGASFGYKVAPDQRAVPRDSAHRLRTPRLHARQHEGAQRPHAETLAVPHAHPHRRGQERQDSRSRAGPTGSTTARSASPPTTSPTRADSSSWPPTPTTRCA